MKIKPIPPGRAASSPTKVPPGTVFPTKYQQDVEERRTFRNRMKVELKNLAKESFLEEMERLRMSNTYIPQSANQTHSPNNDIERQHYLESEIQRLQSVVEDIRKQQPSGGVVGGGNYFPTMNVEWSNHIVRDQMVSPNLPPINSYGGGDYGGRPRAFSESHNDPAYDPPFSTPNPRNQHFVLSSAPIQGFDELIKQETSLFRDTMNFTKSLPGTASHPPHFNQPHQPHAPAPGHGLNSLSIVEQANRIAEMQSLFQLPATLPSIVSEINSFVDPEYQAMHDYANSPEGRYHERQRKIQIHSEQRDKLEKTISAHKDRLDKGRHPSRRFPLSVPATHNQHRQIVSGQSPRVRIHHQRSLSAPTEGSQKALGESSHTDRADESAANSPSRFAQTAPILANAANPTPFTSRAVSPSAPRSPPRSPKAEKSDGEKNDTAEAKDKPKTADKPPTMTAGEFQVKTDKMKEELRKLVREAVHEELVQEGKALRYTKRFQNHYISTQQPLLVQRIEKSVEDRIKTMQNELAALRTTRLNKTTQRRRHDEDGSTSGSDDDEKSRGHGGWFTRNELNGDAEIDMRALTTEINRSVQHIIKRHLGGGGGGGGGGGSYDPNATVVHGHIGSDTYVDDKEVGFENQDPSPRSKPAMNTHTNTATTSNAPQTIGNRAAAAAAAAIVDDPPPKPKSKADRLLGISTDPKTGLQFNEPTPSHKPGLFGSIGNLFHSSKPNAPAHDNSSMMSNRFGSNRSSMYSHQPQPAPPQPSPTPPPSAAFSPAKTLNIVEEGEEDNSQKEKSEKKTKKNRKGSVVSTSEGIANAAATTGQTSAKTDDNSVSGASAMNPSLVAEIAAEETNYRTLMSNLLNAADLKMNVKKELKDWEKEFEGKNGRQPNNEDKMPMSERYIAYKMVSRLCFVEL